MRHQSTNWDGKTTSLYLLNEGFHKHLYFVSKWVHRLALHNITGNWVLKHFVCNLTICHMHFEGSSVQCIHCLSSFAGTAARSLYILGSTLCCNQCGNYHTVCKLHSCRVCTRTVGRCHRSAVRIGNSLSPRGDRGWGDLAWCNSGWCSLRNKTLQMVAYCIPTAFINHG